jgi:hypothetical protein
MTILMRALFGFLKVAFLASLKIVLLAYPLFVSDTRREPKRQGAAHMLRWHPGQFRRRFLTT